MALFCYLLDSDHPRASSLGGRTYIGFTVNPTRREKQHNGLLANGAFKTRKWRPWEMVALVTGFANQRTALQFEWTWQHGETSLDTREAMLLLQGMVQQRFAYGQKKALKIGGVVGQVLRLVAMLSTPPWKHFPLQVRVTSGPLWRLVGDALRMLVGSCEGGDGDSFLLLPEHIGVSVGPLEDFLVDIRPDDEANEDNEDNEDNEENEDNEDCEDCEDGEGGGIEGDERQLGGKPSSGASVTPSPGKVGRKNMKIRCLVCLELAQRTWSECEACGGRTHVGCLAAHYLDLSGGSGASAAPVSGITDLPRQLSCLPDGGSCPHCQVQASWSDVLVRLRTAGWRKNRAGADGGGTPGEIRAETLEDTRRAIEGGEAYGAGNKGKENAVPPARKPNPKPAKGHNKCPGKSAAVASERMHEATTPLEALIRRTEMLHLDQGGDDGVESLASRCLRRLQQQEIEAPAAPSGQEIIDLCSPSSSDPSESGGLSVVDVIDLASDGCPDRG